jgi:CBS domain-containing protein
MYYFRTKKEWGDCDENPANGKRRCPMKAREVMTGTPYYCQPETNLGSATELMWNANCGFLPVEAADGKVIGVITDRDICIALGTRGWPSGDVTVAEVMSGKLCSCAPDDDIHVALQTLREGKVRRLPVIAADGSLVGVISMDDVLLRTEPLSLGKEPELSSDEVVRTFRAITQRQVPEVVRKQATAA